MQGGLTGDLVQDTEVCELGSRRSSQYKQGALRGDRVRLTLLISRACHFR